MTFAEAIRSGLTQYVNFSGRARRSAYWYFVLFNILVLIVAAVLDTVIGTYPLLYGIAALALFLPNLGVTVRRLHDVDKSGWFVLIGLIPIVGGILLIVWCCGDSVPDNQYGPNPKGVGGQTTQGYGAPNPYAG